MDVLDIIQSDHDAIEALIEKLEAVADSTADRDIARAAELCGQLAIEVHLHLQSEERVLYRACTDAGLRDFANAGHYHHILVDTMLDEVRTHRPGPDGRLHAAVAVLKDVVRRHARDEEEHVLLPLLRQALSDEQRAALGQAMLAERERIRPQVEHDSGRPGRHHHAASRGRAGRPHAHHHHH